MYHSTKPVLGYLSRAKEKHGGKTVLGFRLEDEKKDYIDNIISEMSKNENIDKGEALYIIINSYNEIKNKQEIITKEKYEYYKQKFIELKEDIIIEQKQFEPYNKDKFLKYDKELSKWIPINWGLPNHPNKIKENELK